MWFDWCCCVFICHHNFNVCLSLVVLKSGFSLLIWSLLFQIALFCPGKISSFPENCSARGELSAEPHMRCLVLLLRKEDASHHILALVKGNAFSSQKPQHFRAFELEVKSLAKFVTLWEDLRMLGPDSFAVWISRPIFLDQSLLHILHSRWIFVNYLIFSTEILLSLES